MDGKREGEGRYFAEDCALFEGEEGGACPPAVEEVGLFEDF
jgi:hypothetical protein